MDPLDQVREDNMLRTHMAYNMFPGQTSDTAFDAAKKTIELAAKVCTVDPEGGFLLFPPGGGKLGHTVELDGKTYPVTYAQLLEDWRLEEFVVNQLLGEE